MIKYPLQLCSKCILVLLTISIFGLCQSKPTDSQSVRFYKAIESNLKAKYPEDQKLASCILNDFKGNKLADEIYSAESILEDGYDLSKEIQPHEKKAKHKCDIALWFSTPFGILIILSVLLVLTILCCCLLKFFCCR